MIIRGTKTPSDKFTILIMLTRQECLELLKREPDNPRAAFNGHRFIVGRLEKMISYEKKRKSKIFKNASFSVSNGMRKYWKGRKEGYVAKI